MITGFNTDIPYKGVTYHVQTEDKGLDTPLILSLVYVGGAIIASKRTRYDDLIEAGFDETVLTERLQRQHKLICAAIRSGRIEDLKRMGERDGAHEDESGNKNGHESVLESKATKGRKKRPATQTEKPVEPIAVEKNVTNDPVSVQEQGSNIEIIRTMSDEISAMSDVVSTPEQVFPQPEPAEPFVHGDRILKDPLQTVQSEFVHQPFVAPPKPVVDTPPPHTESPEAGQEGLEELYLSLLDDEGEFRAGQLATIKVHVGRGAYGRMPLPDASVTVKVLGTSFRPLILATSTDERGVAVVRALLPRFTSGRAAIIIRAASGEDAVELRRIIHQA